MTHYYPKDRKDVLSAIAAANAFTGPEFVGQGLSRQVGSDCYGYYIVSIKEVNGKRVVGIVEAASRFEKSWADGDMICSLPNHEIEPSACKATQWITISGKFKKSGKPKWWYCSENGKKFNGQRASFNWNGAYEYSDPSF